MDDDATQPSTVYTTYLPVSIWSKVRYMSLSFSALITCCNRMMFSCPLRACGKESCSVNITTITNQQRFLNHHHHGSKYHHCLQSSSSPPPTLSSSSSSILHHHQKQRHRYHHHLQIHDLPKGTLCISGIAESIEALLQGNHRSGALLNRLPHDAICLKRLRLDKWISHPDDELIVTIFTFKSSCYHQQ